MHKIGTPKDMQKNLKPSKNMIKVFDNFIKKRLKILADLSIDTKKVWFDPGIGFGKTLNQNLQLMRSLKKYSNLPIQILLGSSRKSWINFIDPSKTDERLGGSLASVAHALSQGVNCFRIHDVQETNQMIKVLKVLNK
jgi:dihydropteroate synthase